MASSSGPATAIASTSPPSRTSAATCWLLALLWPSRHCTGLAARRTGDTIRSNRSASGRKRSRPCGRRGFGRAPGGGSCSHGFGRGGVPASDAGPRRAGGYCGGRVVGCCGRPVLLSGLRVASRRCRGVMPSQARRASSAGIGGWPAPASRCCALRRCRGVISSKLSDAILRRSRAGGVARGGVATGGVAAGGVVWAIASAGTKPSSSPSKPRLSMTITSLREQRSLYLH